MLSDAKDRFKEARSKARDAFSNEALDTSDRILAMMVKVMATILEKVDNPVNAITPCRVCLEELHALPGVKKSFRITLAKGLKSRFKRDERNAIIAAVCDISHAIFDVTLIVGSDSLISPLIDVGAENVHPLRDPRVIAIDQKNTQYVGFYPMQWWLGEDILKSVSGICTNTKGQFIVADSQDENRIKVFDCDGNFQYLLSAILRGTIIYDVATDQADNIYVLCQKGDPPEFQVRIFDKDNNLRCSFGFDACFAPSRLCIVEKKSKPESKMIFVLGIVLYWTTEFGVKVIEISDCFLQGEEFAWNAKCNGRIRRITVCDNGNVIAVATGMHGLNRVHVFSTKGEFQHKFSHSVVHEGNPLDKVIARAIHWANNHLIVVSIPHYFWSTCLSSSWDIDVSIYKEDGKLVNHFSITTSHQFDYINSITMNRQGRIALVLCSSDGEKYGILVI